MPVSEEHRVADGLIRLSVLSSSIFAQVADRHELPAAQARLLCVLAGGPRRMSALAAVLGVEKAALTGLADRAERRGLIARTAVPGDRRALSVALTPGGSDAARSFHRELSAELARLTDVLPPAECARFSRSLDRITADAPWPLPRLPGGPAVAAA
jgi:DNA-binding MarR family transcriptional regulator